MAESRTEANAMPEPVPGRILVCDDDAVQCALLQQILTRLGYSCDTASDGRQALACLRQTEYAALITDIFMAEMDGIELMRALRDSGNRLPVVAMTGGLRGVLRPYAEFMRAMGAVAVLAKPFTLEELSAALEKAFEASQEASQD